MILVTGGAGYIGSVLVPRLLARGESVTVLDCFLYGDTLGEHAGLTRVAADIRDTDRVRDLFAGQKFKAVIHLAAISNDPSSKLDPALTREVNLDALGELFRLARNAEVPRLLYASSASVYGLKSEPNVVETLSLEPMTDYARFKAQGEALLNELCDDTMCGVSVRSATVCGYAPRLRLDLTINILTEHAVNRGKIRVFGGTQERPNVHVSDLCDLYIHLLDAPADRVNREAFNVVKANSSVAGLAEMIRAEVDPSLPIETVPTDDLRSYRLSGAKLEERLGFVPKVELTEAVRELASALRDGRVPDPEAAIYRNVAHMKAHPEFCARGGA